MLKRKRPDRMAQVGPTGSSTPAPTDPFGGFRFAESTTEYPFMHPAYACVYAFFTFKEGGRVTVTTPFAPAERSPRFAPADLPEGEWVQLRDGDGRLLPLAVFVDPLGVMGRWL